MDANQNDRKSLHRKQETCTEENNKSDPWKATTRRNIKEEAGCIRTNITQQS
jgi:hypothetical protein